MTLRLISKARWFFRNNAIHNELSILPLPKYFQKLSLSFLNSHDNEMILNLTAYDYTHRANKKRPLAVLSHSYT
jgi:hypothetical protein